MRTSLPQGTHKGKSWADVFEVDKHRLVSIAFRRDCWLGSFGSGPCVFTLNVLLLLKSVADVKTSAPDSCVPFRAEVLSNSRGMIWLNNQALFHPAKDQPADVFTLTSVPWRHFRNDTPLICNAAWGGKPFHLISFNLHLFLVWVNGSSIPAVIRRKAELHPGEVTIPPHDTHPLLIQEQFRVSSQTSAYTERNPDAFVELKLALRPPQLDLSLLYRKNKCVEPHSGSHSEVFWV